MSRRRHRAGRLVPETRGARNRPAHGRRGLLRCAASEAQAISGQDVFVVGGANSAGQASVFFSRVAARVTIVCRSGALERGMSRYLIDQIEAIPTIGVRLDSQVVEAQGGDRLEAVTLVGEERLHLGQRLTQRVAGDDDEESEL